MTVKKYTQALECDFCYQNVDPVKILALKNFLNQISFEKQLTEQMEAGYLVNHTGELDSADAYLKKHYPDGVKGKQKWLPNTEFETVDVQVLSERLSECEDPVPVVFTQSLQIGFFDKKKNKIFISRFSDVNPIWRPTTTIQSKVAERDKSEQDKYVGQFFRTTIRHKLDFGYVGVLAFNDPVLPTTIGGRLSPLQPTGIGRYVMRWVNWTQQQRRMEEVTDVDEMLEKGLIETACPNEKQRLNRPDDYCPEAIPKVTPEPRRNSSCPSWYVGKVVHTVDPKVNTITTEQAREQIKSCEEPKKS